MRTGFVLLVIFGHFGGCLFQYVTLEEILNQDVELKKFYKNLIGGLSPNSRTDLVFLLDESGSIRNSDFDLQKLFAELVSRFFVISSDKTRIALVTYANYGRIRFDFTQSSKGDMCNFIKNLKKVTYKGGFVNQHDGLLIAGNILKKSNVTNKVIIMLSDGKKNLGKNPVSIARELKRKEILVFCVGLKKSSKKELLNLATAKSHVYMLNNANVIARVNDQLKNMNFNHLVIPLPSNICKGICDVNARCECHSDGDYKCSCLPGYTGSGYDGKCFKCPLGTYSSGIGQNKCTSCPLNSITLLEGSISVDNCTCEFGFRGNPKLNRPCQKVKCPPLSAPSGGVLVPPKCGRHLNDTCSFWCKYPNCPYDGSNINCINEQSRKLQPERRCLPTGRWSGPEMTCEEVKCSELPSIPNVRFECDLDNKLPGSKCRIKCVDGFYLPENEVDEITCENDGSWRIPEVECLPATCAPLKISAKMETEPEDCTFQTELPYGITCLVKCTNGYELTFENGTFSHGLRICNSSGLWTGGDDDVICQDSYAPDIVCPDPIVVINDPLRRTALVEWFLPSTIDNDAYPATVRLEDPKGIKSPYSFDIGVNTLVYKATDINGLTSICNFTITVLDDEAPMVKYCPPDQEIYSKTLENGVRVFWKEPEFWDNSEHYYIKSQTRNSGDLFFTDGLHQIIYQATDESGNSAQCQFHVKIKPYQCPFRPPPLNGLVNCGQDPPQECDVNCNDGFEFISQPELIYSCEIDANGNADWTTVDTWPDCAEISGQQVPSLNGHVLVNVFDCDDAMSAKKEFEEIVEEVLQNNSSACNYGKRCEFAAGRPTCLPGQVKSERRKRNVERKLNSMVIGFHLKFYGDRYKQGDLSEDVIFPDSVRSEIKSRLENILNDDDSTTSPVFLIDDEFEENCDVGEIYKFGICLKCPIGTFFDLFTLNCEPCELNTYQDVDASTSCKPCPPLSYTLHNGAKNITECKEPCQPGYYSTTGFDQCLACPVGTFQDKPQQQSCEQCPSNTTTWSVGANTKDFCTTPCFPGSFSSTGFAPCQLCPKGTYQDKENKVECEKCPEELTTTILGTVNASDCLEINVCKVNPCKNDATCVQEEGGSFKCLCNRGFIGLLCEINDEDCGDLSCFNGGTCIDGENDFTCKCPLGFSGLRCETDVDDCADENVCLNGGTCVDLINSFMCDCTVGFAGEFCEINFDDCENVVCQNGGTCHDGANNFFCCCPPGFTGTYCELDENSCYVMPCLNGGQCISGTGKPTCLCPQGFTGDNCEFKVNHCLSNPCENNGVCTSMVVNFECECPVGFTGSRCEIQLSLDFDIVFPVHDVVDFSQIHIGRDLYAVTLSFWVKSESNEEYRPTPISFSYKSPITHLRSNALTVYNLNKVTIFLHGIEIPTDIALKNSASWHHFVLTWDSVDGSLNVYKDGVLRLTRNRISPKIPLWRGILLIGQDQSALADNFLPVDSFKGSLTQLNLWDFVMTSNQIKLLHSTCGYIGNVVGWSDVLNNLQGPHATFTEPSHVCSTKNKCGQTDEECHCHYNKINDASLCENQIDSCLLNQCQFNQTCQQEKSTQYCQCVGFKGKFCQYDVNECAFNDAKCSHDCVNTLGSYSCSCPPGMTLSFDRHNCVPLRQCSHNGLLYTENEKWDEKCYECVCSKGEVRCHTKKCPKLKCSQNEFLRNVPGECCPVCIDESASCVVTPKNVFTTFDGYTMTYSGGCRYILAQDCSGGNFQLQVESDVEYPDKKNLLVIAGCTVVEISSQGETVVDGNAVDLPYDSSDLVRVTVNEKNLITVITSEGIIVRLPPSGSIKVSVPKKMFRKMCGLCGDFNNDGYDDMKLRNYIMAYSLTEFILDWSVDTVSCSTPKYDNPGRPDYGSRVGVCDGTNKNWDEAQEKCEAFRTLPFQECYSFIDPREFYELCIQDVCACEEHLCHCDAINIYVAHCNKYNVSVTGWLGEDECRERCQNGMVFDVCGQACESTCEKEEENDPRCQIETCRAGCHCPNSMVLHDGYCIEKHLCKLFLK